MFNSPTRRGFSLFSRIISTKDRGIILANVKIQDGDSSTLADVKNDGTDNALVVAMNIIPDVDINDISKGVQTNDVKVTLDGETVMSVVSATNLDIRDLTSVSDSVEVKQSTSSNLKGEMKITDGTDIAEVLSSNADSFSNSTNQLVTASFTSVFNGSSWDRLRGDTSGVNTQGNIAHDSVDSGNPIKLGAVATDWDPDTEGDQGPTAVAEGDRVELTADLKGRLVERVQSKYELLTGIDNTFDGTPSTATSTAIDCFDYRWCTFSFDLSSAGSPTDFTFQIQVSADGTNWHKLTDNALGNLIYSDASVATEIQEAITFPIVARKIRVKVTGTGLGASDSFTTDNCAFMLRN